MEVHFKNSYGPRIWIAIMRYDPGTCGQYGNWATAGWWNVSNGQSVHAFNTSNRYFCYYAEAADGHLWTGNYGPIYVYRDAFSSCLNIGSTAAYGRVGTRLKDGGNSDKYTVNLVA